MTVTSLEERQRIQRLDRAALSELQLKKLNCLIKTAREHNAFYRRKLTGCPEQLDNIEQLALLPQTSKEELLPELGEAYFGTNRTYDIDQYVRFHQTSGTHGRPLGVLDTPDDWRWWIEAWQYMLDAAEVTQSDRALLAFSFGPFVGFWSAFDALTTRGVLVVPSGGLSSLARLELIQQTKVTTICCTPTYALRLAEVAAEHNINLHAQSVKRLIVAGEPGGSISATRSRIESAWDASVYDHAGATEVGPWGFGFGDGGGLYINESQFLPEFVSIESGHRAKEGELAQLVMTTLGRHGAPVIRYQTGDLVRPVWSKRGNSSFIFLDGGILSRADDMLIVRGMNVYPTAIEQILHSFPEVVEYRITARKQGTMDELIVEVEDHLQQPSRIAQELQLKLGLKIDVHCAPAMSLPRFEGKGKRFVDERTATH